MNSTVLASLGVRLDQEDLHSELLAVVKERKLGREVVTNQFILEIRDQLEVRGPGGIIRKAGRITRRQACHILAFLADQTRFPNEDLINPKVMLQLWRPRDLDKLQTMHYGAAVKWSQKCPTLTNYFSMDFDQGVPKYCI